jgi:Effector-associated domain 11
MTAKEFKEQIRELISHNKTDEAIQEMETRFKQEDDDELLNIITVIRGEFKGLNTDAIKGVIDEKELRQAIVKINNRLLNVLKDIEDKTSSHAHEVKAACKAASALLMYLSENTNSKTVFYKDAHENYFLRKAQGQAFIDTLSAFSLVHGHGQHLPKAIKEDFYKFRAKVYKIIEKAKLNQDLSDEILINNVDVKNFVATIRNQISEKLKPYL